jgi:hypothetical protein
MSQNKQTSLSKLYQQKKSDTPMPDHLKSALMKHGGNRRHQKSWWVAMPAAMASLLVVIVFWPNSEIIMTEFQTASAPTMMEEKTIDLEIMEPLEVETSTAKPQAKVSSETQSPPALNIARSAREQTSKEKSVFNNDAGLALSDDSDSTFSISSEDSERVYSPSESEVLEYAQPIEKSVELDVVNLVETELDVNEADQAAISESSDRFWQIIDGALGQFRDCEGQLHSLDITTKIEVGVWVKVIIKGQTEITIEKLDDYQCKPTD